MRDADTTASSTSAPAPRDVAPAATRTRDPWFDNAKMTLVVLVVVGHSWTLLPSDDGVQSWLYDFLYSWHIPAFVIVTGYLSKSFTWTRPRLVSLLTTVALPYVLFEGLYALFRHEVGGVEFARLWTNPHWPMWYLSALFFWRLMVPVLNRIPAKVVVAVAISLVAGLYATDLFDNARIFGLLPFFVLGLKMHEGHWTLLRSRRARWWGIGALLVLLVLARFSGSWFESEWFYYRTRYDALDPDNLRALVIRMCLLLSGLVGAFAFFTVVPRGRSWYSAMGSATLVVYLFHGFLVLGAEFAGYPSWATDHMPGAMLLVTACAVLVAVALAWKPVSTRLDWLVDPVGSLRRHRTARA
ncbi:MAG: acyltransferase 3 [Marmoricola sp.]|nr:acyltransferase 3 [Marmoricola sp.]